eukprot:CAMPEP_0170389326 /NCGR_PEP_ID=MMETSP0117_2-20130122/18557_1 /TAXON_ID=400756 /ORGANISM="Durinskia baltica, Strain CSIRO CS-38" /LENGTH=55 /DNA_ID=CAMNT_0010645305 /DNA_START=882 /DNA_END=1049 /DNA_ORIENTATION=-
MVGTMVGCWVEHSVEMMADLKVVKMVEMKAESLVAKKVVKMVETMVGNWVEWLVD